LLNIDGCRMDVFQSVSLPNIARLKRAGSTCDNGLKTVYRALTNPAFASILTGAFPEEHGVRNNNFGQVIQTEGLPDRVRTKLYGSMHVKHFSKAAWDTTVISLPTTSAYRCDEEMVRLFKNDFERCPDTRLFVLDFSEADFLGHAYGSTSRPYKEALRKIDLQIGHIYDWLESTDRLKNTAIIVCSDHGMKAIDHSYLLFQEEKYVPFMVAAPGIKANHHYVREEGSIVDICANVAFLLGIDYPKSCHGRVYLNMYEGIDSVREREEQIILFNKASYDAAASTYDEDHPEVREGDAQWWENMLTKYLANKKDATVLDYGCGTGFIGEVFSRTVRDFRKFVCFDISKSSLAKAQQKLGGDSRFVFLSDWKSVEKLGYSFDLVTLNSVLHHIHCPDKTINQLNQILVGGGLMMGAHEPNRLFFGKPLKKILGELYKKLGNGVEFREENLPIIQRSLKEHGYTFPLTLQEIQQLVEYHSPVEQHPTWIDPEKGFDPDDLFNRIFDGYKICEKRFYSTALNRKSLRLPAPFQKMITRLLCGDSGNLISYVILKQALDQRHASTRQIAL
ncbi:MAG: alkaline phosphatase family protein, partial [Deltaproteobacteria bacterium]|nr:alkaline phosphatase family protein [Deltaproteobacteria bacterium]